MNEVRGPVRRIAAALILTFQALSWNGGGPSEVSGRAGAAELMAALGPRRPVEPRLTWQRSYSPCLAVPSPQYRVPDARCSALPKPGSWEFAALLKIGKRLQVRHASTAMAFQALGLERLIWHRAPHAAEESVAALEKAVDLAPRDAHLWSDLAAARYVEAQLSGEPSHLLGALAAAERAVALAPALPEALFNHALVLDRLYLRGQATVAWQRYLKADFDSPWVKEAQFHLKKLRAASVSERWRQQLPTLRAAAVQGDEAELRTLVATCPQMARESAIDVLGEWGSLFLAGKNADAAVELRIAAGIGRALSQRGGDHTIEEAVAVVAGARQPEALTLLARGHRAYALGSGSFRRLEIEAAAAPFRETLATLGRASSPVGLWAEEGLAGVALYRAQYEEAATAFASLLARTDADRFPALAGRLHWGLGLTRLRQGRLSEALTQYHAALAQYARIPETENLGTLHAWVAEILRLLGDKDLAWRERYHALSDLRGFPTSARLHTLLWEAADAAKEEVGPQVALVLQEEGLQVAERLSNPQLIAEAFLRRSRILAALGIVDAAISDLHRADVSLDRSPKGDIREKLQSDVLFSRGEIEGGRDPHLAIKLYDQAIVYYRLKNRLLNLAAAHLNRARSELTLGLDSGAVDDLDAAIRIFEQKRVTVADKGLRLSYSEAVQDLFDARILLEVRRAPTDRALELAERARAVPLERLETPATPESGAAPLALAAPPEVRLAQRLPELPANVAFVEYAWVRDRLFRWTVRRDGVTLDSDTRVPAGLTARIEELAEAARTGSVERWEQLSSLLSRDLLPQAVRTLAANVQVFFVPDKALNGISFAALRNPATGRYLAEEHPAVGVVPSISFYLDTLKRRDSADIRTWSALLVGNPAFDRNVFAGLRDLSGAENEIAEIGPLYPGARVLRGPLATGTNFLSELDRHEILEFAGHAVNNPQHPAYSYLVFAPEPGHPGALYAHQLAGRQLKRLRLAVLNGCHTIGARNLRVGGLSGLARPFLDAGAQAVLGTLWDVDDGAARRVLSEFHHRFRVTGDAAVALHEAQLTCLGSSNAALRSPAVWGAFQLVGAITSHHH